MIERDRDRRSRITRVDHAVAVLLVTDIRMPHMDGFELFDRQREVIPGSRAVFISGYSETAYARALHGVPREARSRSAS